MVPGASMRGSYPLSQRRGYDEKMRARSALALLALTAACGGDEEKAPVKKPPVAPTGCAAGELEQADGSCLPAGVPADACGQGFESDGALGCQAILPPAPCT